VEDVVTATIQWPRFLIVSIVGSIIVLALYSLWTGTVVASMNLSPGVPSRPPEEMKALLPFLAVISVVQLVTFCYLYLRVYPQRDLGSAVWWGAWGGFFMVLPDGQFFVGTPNQTWSALLVGWADGIAAAIMMTVLFQLVYRPKNESWTPVPTDWRRFLVTGALSSVLVFVLDISFHMHLAQLLFTEYPAHDFPQRPAEEATRLMPWLFLTYLFQLSIFCYLFTRIYPRRGMGNAIWFGAWLGVWVVIPNMQFFTGLDKYTWHMLVIQVVEAAVLTMIMMVFFEWAYRPRAAAGRLAAAQYAIT
jgi:hypothetical protein